MFPILTSRHTYHSATPTFQRLNFGTASEDVVAPNCVPADALLTKSAVTNAKFRHQSVPASETALEEPILPAQNYKILCLLLKSTCLMSRPG